MTVLGDILYNYYLISC